MTRRNRPILSLPWTPLEKLLEVLAALCLIGLIALTFWGWSILPNIIPTHFGISGQPNAYGGKGNVFFLPIVFLLVYVLITCLERFPHIYNYPVIITEENAPLQYHMARKLLEWIKLEALVMGCILQWLIIQSEINHNSSGLLIVTVIFPIMFLITIAMYLTDARRAQ